MPDARVRALQLFCPALHCITLTALYLRNNKIRSLGAQHLADALRNNTTLTTLGLQCNELGPLGAEHLADALQNNTTLTTLYLGGNEIGDKGAQHLAKALRNNMTLTTLDIRDNQIGDKGTKYLTSASRNNTATTTSLYNHSQTMPTLTQTGNDLYLPKYKPLAENQSPSVIKVLDVQTLATIPEKTSTSSKLLVAILIGCASAVIITIAIVVPLLLTKKSSSSSSNSTTICQNGGTLLSNDSCACNNYTTGTYCQTPLCLVAGFFSTTCLNGGTCTYSASTSTSTCSCVSSSWTGSYCQTPLCPNCNYNCGYGSCNSPSSCYCNSGYQGTCCNSTITSGQCLSLSPANTTSWGSGFNNTFYGHENDVLNVSCATGKTLTVAACFYGINSATPGCSGSTGSANCLSMDVSSTCSALSDDKPDHSNRLQQA
ncbi:unnamed protein product [Rotaria sordida]|uniref:EGF-like domain-containing protein n=1 Tax=Rotaria sordida TaxID=392033 RepID=A0A814RYY8_9BILA|nr:unnamed protein product [Rotaria sordida]CAF1370794.1 unnamed protein product [Rotaria sordida]